MNIHYDRKTSLIALGILSGVVTLGSIILGKGAEVVAACGGVSTVYALSKLSSVAVEDDRGELTQKITELQTELQAITHTRDRLQARVDIYTDADGNPLDLPLMREHVRQLVLDLQSANQRLGLIEPEIERLRSENAQLQADNATLRATNVQLQSQVAALTIDDNDAAKRIKDQYERIHQLEVDLAAKNAPIKAIEDLAQAQCDVKLAKLKEDLATVSKQLKSLHTDYSSLVDDHEKLAKRYGEVVPAVNSTITELQSEYSGVISNNATVIAKLEAALTGAIAPRLFPGDSVGARRANAVMRIVADSGANVVLHRNTIVCGASEDTITYEVNDFVDQSLLQSLNGLSFNIQQVHGLLSLPEFAAVPGQGNLIRVQYHHAKAVAKPKNDGDAVDRLWVPATKFRSEIRGLLTRRTIRIVGGSGSGKGQTAAAIITVYSDDHIVELHDPKSKSMANYWKIPAKSKTGSEIPGAIAELATLSKIREEGGDKIWNLLAVFDEIDASCGKPEYKILLDLAVGIRHEGIRQIIIGQNSNVRGKGWEWSDMGSMSMIGCGSAALTLISNHPNLGGKDKLKAEYDLINDYCSEFNDRYGFGADDAGTRRFALLVSDGISKGYRWLEIPPTTMLDCDWSTVRTDRPDSSASATVAATVATPKESTPLKCPECQSTSIKNNGKHRTLPNTNYRKCNDCGAKFVG